jgi:hypothetical protein
MREKVPSELRQQANRGMCSTEAKAWGRDSIARSESEFYHSYGKANMQLTAVKKSVYEAVDSGL